jgi:hypothetical protein
LRHLSPAIVVGIRHYESRQKEEEVDGEISVIDDLVKRVAEVMRLKDVKDHDHHCGYAAQAI